MRFAARTIKGRLHTAYLASLRAPAAAIACRSATFPPSPLFRGSRTEAVRPPEQTHHLLMSARIICLKIYDIGCLFMQKNPFVFLFCFVLSFLGFFLFLLLGICHFEIDSQLNRKKGSCHLNRFSNLTILLLGLHQLN